jgi:Flp pilus assembly protein TadG
VTRELQCGSAAVEFALVLPQALRTALALVQVGLLGREALLVTHAAREAVREAAVVRDDDRIRQAALRPGLDGSRAEVLVERSGTTGDPVTVHVAYRTSLLVPFVRWLLPEEVVLRASSTMRQETD